MFSVYLYHVFKWLSAVICSFRVQGLYRLLCSFLMYYKRNCFNFLLRLFAVTIQKRNRCLRADFCVLKCCWICFSVLTVWVCLEPSGFLRCKVMVMCERESRHISLTPRMPLTCRSCLIALASSSSTTHTTVPDLRRSTFHLLLLRMVWMWCELRALHGRTLLCRCSLLSLLFFFPASVLSVMRRWCVLSAAFSMSGDVVFVLHFVNGHHVGFCVSRTICAFQE